MDKTKKEQELKARENERCWKKEDVAKWDEQISTMAEEISGIETQEAAIRRRNEANIREVERKGEKERKEVATVEEEAKEKSQAMLYWKRSAKNSMSMMIRTKLAKPAEENRSVRPNGAAGSRNSLAPTTGSTMPCSRLQCISTAPGIVCSTMNRSARTEPFRLRLLHRSTLSPSDNGPSVVQDIPAPTVVASVRLVGRLWLNPSNQKPRRLVRAILTLRTV
ncbi:uncharacterized protein HMPREF1541_00010 [Cyphellophora europaea CBS 101466]|uniref:Uncharacterized protein n=1 Tax=Cyphellophora europaea (strain CBS 101466) TaxID=1220924 RepID=W2SD35_CYPE1|nr:uncharacterized protein HMPREF1541_00010 [Cyphellophora europaea CBS 101466]ETN45829.1 hypothetical protein HMPREF1541_00010 [Cyphellophora europaea CBS 101466]